MKQTKLSKQQKEILLTMHPGINRTDKLAWKIAKKHATLINETKNLKQYTTYSSTLYDWRKGWSNILYTKFKASFSRSIKRLVERGLIRKEEREGYIGELAKYAPKYSRRIWLTPDGIDMVKKLRNG